MPKIPPPPKKLITAMKPPSNERYVIMRKLLDDAEKYFNSNDKDIEAALLKEIVTKISAYTTEMHQKQGFI